MTSPALTIGPAARAAGLTAKAVRLYEARGLLAAPARNSAGYRLYGPNEIEVLSFIRRARDLGLSLSDVEAILGEHRRGSSPCTGVRILIDSRIARIDAVAAELALERERLVEARRRADSTARMPASRVCPIIEHS